MRTHTTFTDIRFIMKLHRDGFKPEDICAQTFIDIGAIKNVIDQRTKAEKTDKKFKQKPE